MHDEDERGVLEGELLTLSMVFGLFVDVNLPL